MNTVKLLVSELFAASGNASQMADNEFLSIVRKHGFELCSAEPIGWAAHENVVAVGTSGGIIGVGSNEGAVVYDGETWMNADLPIFCSA